MESISVTDVVKRLKQKVEGDNQLQHIVMEGNIIGLKRASTGHYYMNLHDAYSSIHAVFFRGRAGQAMAHVREGDKVIVVGSLNVYEKGGSVSFLIERLYSQGMGSLQVQLEEQKKRLAAAGYFDAAHKQPLPRFPWHIGVLTSHTGAVLHDIRKIAAERNPYITVHLYPIPVQGESAVPEITAALRKAGANRTLDVLILARGGGSMEDLWCFNHSEVVRAIYEAAVPVITAIGHETDITLADYAADVRAATPTHAAELAFPSFADLQLLLTQLTETVIQRMQQRQERYRHSLRQAIAAIRPDRYREYLTLRRQQAISRIALAQRQWHVCQMRKRGDLQTLAARLAGLNPENLGRRGYGQVFKDGQPVASVQSVQTGETLQIQVLDGIVETVVKGVKPYGKRQ